MESFGVDIIDAAASSTKAFLESAIGGYWGLILTISFTGMILAALFALAKFKRR